MDDFHQAARAWSLTLVVGFVEVKGRATLARPSAMETNMRTLNWMRRLATRLPLAAMPVRWNAQRRKLLLAAGLAGFLATGFATADDKAYGSGSGSSKWAASWATSIQSAYVA